MSLPLVVSSFLFCGKGRTLALVLATGLVHLAVSGSLPGAEAPPESKGFQPKNLQVPAGFEVELAAAPPLVQHPTFATFDERGRLFLSENAGVNLSAEELQKQLPNSIRMLEDLDGDGIYDRSTVFADKMTFPMGGAWFQNALYVASPPSIWRLEDTDGDGVADRRDAIVSKFGDTGNAASIHGCILGPDGRLYWCDGYHGHEFTDSSGKITSKREGSYLFSCNADGSDVRIHCGGGMDNPVEVDFTPAGEMLGTVNILYTRPRIDCFVHWLHGGAYPHREKVLKEIQVTGDLLGPVHKFGHVAVSGTLRYRSGSLNPKWQNSFFATFFNSGTVVRLDLQRIGSTYAATQETLLTCEEREFHPTDLIEDADGSLLVVDTGGWFYRGCPTSQFAKPDILGAIYRIRRTGMPRQNDPRGLAIDWKTLPPDQLLKLLGDERFLVRERATSVSAIRDDSIIPRLAELKSHSDAQVRLNAVWALVRRRNMASLLPFLKDSELDVRLAALQGLGVTPFAGAFDALVTILHHGSPAEQNAAAVALGRSGNSQAIVPLLKTLDGDLDRTREHAVIYALIELDRPAQTRTGLADASPRVRRGALIALDQMSGGDLAAKDLIPLVAATFTPLQETALTIFSKHSAWNSQAVDVLKLLADTREETPAFLESLTRLAQTFVMDAAVGAEIGQMLSNPDLSSGRRHALLTALASGQTHMLHESWVSPLIAALKSHEADQVSEALQVLAVCPSKHFEQELQGVIDDSRIPPLERVLAMQIRSGQLASLSDAAFELLETVLTEGSPTERFQAAQKFGVSTLTSSQRQELASQLTLATPNMLAELIRPYGRAPTVADATAFLSALKDARNFTSISPETFQALVKSFPKEVQPAAADLTNVLRAHRQKQLDRLNTILPKLKHGSPQRGETLFFAEKSKCATCHRMGDRGARIGPDLSTIGANRASADLLESILFPSATIVRDYEPYSLATQDGRVYTGLIARETADTLFLQQQTGDQVAIPRNEIDELVPGTVSIMPAGLDQTLSEQDLVDLVAFLQSRKAASHHP